MKDFCALKRKKSGIFSESKPSKQTFLSKIVEEAPQTVGEHVPNEYTSHFSKQLTTDRRDLVRGRTTGEEIVVQRVFNLSYSPMKSKQVVKEKDEMRQSTLVKDSKWKLC